MIEGLDVDILKQFKRNEPIYVRKPIPTFKTEYDRDKYYDNKKRIWVEGEGGLTGMHRFYLDEILLENRVTGDSYYPICRDIDVLIFHKIEELRKKNKWLYITKGRGVGLSTIMFSIPHWFFRMYPGSRCVATTGKDKKTLSHLFSTYFMHGYSNLDELIRPAFINKNETTSESFLRMQIKTKDSDGNLVMKNSSFICRETSDTLKSTTAFSGYGAIYGGFDEIPLHPRRADLIKSAKEIFVDPMTKDIVGFLLGGGTIEEQLKPEDILELKSFVEGCEGLNFHHAFIPATWGNCMVNGWSDLEKAEIKIREKRAELDKLEDKTYLKAEIKNNPLDLDEIWGMGGSSKIEEDVIEKIIHTIKVVGNEKRTGKDYEKPYTITQVGADLIVAPALKSPIVLLEPPQPGVKYEAGNDGTGTTKQGGVEEGSDVSIVITKMFDPNENNLPSYTPVAWYAERPISFDNSYIKMTNLLKHYNQHGLLNLTLQSNQGNEHFGAHLIKNGLEKIVRMRFDLSGKGTVSKSKMGLFVTPDIIDWQYRQANIILRKYGHNYKVMRLLKEILMPYDKNTDILDAWLMSLCGMGIDFDKVIEKKQTVRYRYDKNLREDGTFEIKKVLIKELAENV